MRTELTDETRRLKETEKEEKEDGKHCRQDLRNGS